MSINLTDLANGKNKISEEAGKEETKSNITPSTDDKEVTLEKLKEAWNEFTEQRKSQVGEYHLLKQEFEFSNNLITIQLSNPVEEPLLQSIRTPLTEFLRVRLSNSRINVTSQLKAIQSQKIAYTNKEKFDKLVENNPILNEMKKRLELDTDF
ncbi:MAG TPA: hypothetical protein DIS90_15380 [Cytophagales bacterium]|nr:hypothetical protein [Cytophagales bacterium]HCR53722.1 hypothetical protein [Cytophagales bacterium]